MENIDLKKILEARKFNPELTVTDNLQLLKIDGKIIGGCENIVCLSGLPKSFKSTYLSIIVASAFYYSDIFGIKLSLPAGNKIAYFDTESSQFDFYRQVKRILTFSECDILPETLYCYTFREDSPAMIKKMIEQFLNDNPETSCIIIDGLLDLLIDYNDVKESRILINWMKKITKKYNILILTALHISKGNLTSTGHIGSNIDRYSQSVLLVENVNGNGILSSKFMRSDMPFEPIILQWSGNAYGRVENFRNETPTKKGRR